MILPKGIAIRLDDRGIGGSSKGTIPQQISTDIEAVTTFSK
jgi:hypothetical protein